MAPIVGCMGADADDEDDDHDFESEPTESTSDALSASAVDCNEESMQAYSKGSPSNVKVIRIGGKRVTKTTGHAFLKMQKAALAAGVNLTINSGFRTQSEQQYLYNCYKSGKCNNGNLAARPGYSNHQNGLALDLKTSSWLSNNASKFGFRRTVPSEAWHYEYSGADPGGPCSGGRSTETNVDDAPAAPSSSPSAGSPSSSAGVGKACASHGQCNPGNDGSGLICVSSKCVAGCVSNAQCPGSTSCQAGQCR
jgi:hypothetical protein